MRSFRPVACAAVVVLAAAIGTRATLAAPQAIDLHGAWNGSGGDSQGNMTMTWDVSQAGSTVSGTVSTHGYNDSSCASCHKTKNGTLSGTITGSSLTLTMSFPSGGDVPSPMCVVTFDASASGVTTSSVVASYTGTESCEGAIANGTFTMARTPLVPTGLSATAAGTSEVTVAWSAAAGASSYTIKRATASGAEVAIAAGVTSTSYSDLALSAGTTYYYVVAAVNSSGASADSAETSATTDLAAPGAPSTLTATASGASQINLSWTAGTGATSYTVKRSTTSGAETTLATGVAATSYADTSLAAGTTYYYVVAGVNDGGTGANSAEASATTVVGAPDVPTGLTATASSTSQVNLGWTASTGAASYIVKRSATSGAETTLASGIVATSYADTSLSAGTTYYYVVAAVNTGGTSANSSEASVTTPSPPTVASVSPSPGSTAGGTVVTVTGANFVSGATTVTIGGGAATNVSAASTTSLTAVTPAHAAGAATVTVSTTYGAGSLASGFTYSASLFTDDPLQVGVTVVKAVHVTELRTYIDTLRSRYGLVAYAWTDPLLAANGTAVKVVHITDLRTALQAVYTAAGRTPPTYSDPVLAAGSTTVKAVHLSEIRAAVAAIY
jgi:fibronectin type 3 domain-containing protein